MRKRYFLKALLVVLISSTSAVIVLESKVTRKFQVTIPREIREALGINIGDKVIWEIGQNGVAILRKAEVRKNIDEFRGVWRKHPLLKRFKDSVKAIRWLRGHEVGD